MISVQTSEHMVLHAEVCNSCLWLFVYLCRITGTLPRVLGVLNNLTTLDLSSNQMTGFLPTTWGLLSNLTTL